MRTKTLGRTGLLVSELCLGTMTLGGKGFWTAIGQLDQSVLGDLDSQHRASPQPTVSGLSAAMRRIARS